MTLADVAEEIGQRAMPLEDKARILLAIARAQGQQPQRRSVESIGDVDGLLLTEPDEFERLLRAYWLLLGVRMRPL